ncbi:MAG: hypothetical protein JOZ92_04705 [Candidatus Dormibacteraeota bacterium]|nr:hypothetical protein [Candidatus Dormibacteraeota bacterium]
MRPRARLRLFGGSFALLAMAGLWIGHSLEYIRVWGTRGFTAILTGSVHAYMLPVGVALTLVAAFVSLAAFRLWVRLGHRLDTARAALGEALLGRRLRRHPANAALRLPSTTAALLLGWPVLSAVQVGLYLAQENLEAIRVGLPAPGFGAITGVHALAPAVHAAVAIVLLLLVAAAARLFRRRTALISGIERRIRRLVMRRRSIEVRRPPASAPAPPLRLLGAQLWCRPPPLPA